MSWQRLILRWALVTVIIGMVLAIISGVVGEFFIEWAKEKRWYDEPGRKVAAAMDTLSTIIHSRLFAYAIGIALGAMLALVMDAILRRREAVPGDSDEEQFYSDEPEAEVLDKAAYNEIVAFSVDSLLPACDALFDFQGGLIRHASGNAAIASLAISGLYDRRTSEKFLLYYNRLSSGLTQSPGPIIRFEPMLECIFELERDSYNNARLEADKLARSVNLDPPPEGELRQLMGRLAGTPQRACCCL